jgi:hypothetical protein
MKVLSLSYNNFVGVVLDSVVTMSLLNTVDVEFNKFTGTIPNAICNLHAMQILWLHYNALSGTIPNCLGNLTRLETIELDTNNFEGTIPPSLGTLPSLDELGVFTNHLTGPIPESLCSLPAIFTLSLEFNSLTGTLPDCLGNLTLLIHLGLDHNHFYGTIPHSFALLPHMKTMWFSHNRLTGTMPDVSIMYNLEELTMGLNQLTGPIHDCFHNLTNLKFLNFTSNHFTGTIPPSIGLLPLAKTVELDTNLLTGTVPRTLAGLHSAVQIYLNNNFFHGDLSGIFNATNHPVLLDLFVDDNQLTGTLPDEIFLLPKLNTFVAQGNCFIGTLSPTICASPAMVSLILDGLHTASSCRQTLLSATGSYVSLQDVHGTIPPCLLSMGNLIALHLSGNGFTGTLSGTAAINALLVDLTVSHNYLTGTIPLSIQAHGWRNLDLSFNRFMGVLQSDFGSAILSDNVGRVGNVSYNSTGNSVDLQNNRLSGRIPAPLVHMLNISMLGSNMFACKMDKSDLPVHDSNRDSYQCGSDSFNGPFYLAIVLMALGVVALVLLKRRDGSMKRLDTFVESVAALLKRWKLDRNDLPRYLDSVLNLSNVLRRLSVLCTLLIVVVLVPWYSAAHVHFGTYTHQYAWTVSAGFLSGVTPMEVEFALYCALTLAVAGGAAVIVVKVDDRAGKRGDRHVVSVARAPQRNSTYVVRPRWQLAAIYAMFLAVNLAVVVGVNAGFVAIALTQSNGVLVFAQILLSIFKLLWNTVGTPFLVSIVLKYVSPSDTVASTHLITTQVFLGLFNNIAVPCLVVAVLSPSCFYDVFDAAPAVLSTFIVQTCEVQANFVICTYLKPVLLSSVFEPPYSYNYQCSSSFVTYYASAFVYLGLAAGAGVPSLNAFCLWCIRHAPQGSWRYAALQALIPRLLLPELELSASARASSASSIFPLFDVQNYVVGLLTYLGILLTYGVVFPPLAVVMCATILSVVLQTKLSLGRFLNFAKEQNAPELADSIGRECRGAVSLPILRRSIFMIICISCTFYALFLFDMCGDQTGLHGAYWVLFAMPLFPTLLYVIVQARRFIKKSRNEPEIGFSVDVEGFELQARTQPIGEDGGDDKETRLDKRRGVKWGDEDTENEDADEGTFNALVVTGTAV